jgi:hypothetical protein
VLLEKPPASFAEAYERHHAAKEQAEQRVGVVEVASSFGPQLAIADLVPAELADTAVADLSRTRPDALLRAKVRAQLDREPDPIEMAGAKQAGRPLNRAERRDLKRRVARKSKNNRRQ